MRKHPLFWALPARVLCCGPVEKIAIAIAALDQAAMFVADALHDARYAVPVGLDVEVARRTHTVDVQLCAPSFSGFSETCHPRVNLA